MGKNFENIYRKFLEIFEIFQKNLNKNYEEVCEFYFSYSFKIR